MRALLSSLSLGRRRLREPLKWRALKVRALLWGLFALWTLAQPITLVESTTCEGAALVSVR